jgi:LacI family transcriptional regulator
MDDVAKAAKVSVTTVSHVLNGTRKVNPDTEKVVRTAIQEVGYIQNSLARSLAMSATSTIGVAIPTFSNHYFSEVVRSIESECMKNGLMMLFSDTHDDPDQELKIVQAFHQRRVDGVVLAPADDGRLGSLAYLRENKMPTVIVDHLLSQGFDQVGLKNKQAAQELVTHLIEHGHKRIGFVSGAAWNSTSAERLDGYRTALRAAGLPYEEKLVCCGESAIDPARGATRQLLSLDPRPTAIMTSNNLMTIGAMHALREANIDVPREMAFVGFDDFDWADLFNPRLTVVSQPLEEIGAKALNLLIKRIKNPEGNRQTIRLPSTLRIRNSCGCP